jgi:hypothetical protein
LYTAVFEVQELLVMKTQTLNPKVDAYLEEVQPFARPIMEHLRELVHRACPNAEETIKWSRPFFEYRGAILCNMSAFKEHCSFGFWGEEIAAGLREAKVLGADGMGSLGRITSLKDLPSDKQMLGWIRQAAAFVDSGQYTSPIAARRKVVKPQKASADAPAEFTAALKKISRLPRSLRHLARAANVSTWSGSPRQNARRRGTNGSRPRLSGSPRVSSATGNIRTADLSELAFG